MEFIKSHYIHLFGDYYRVRTDLDFLEKKVDAIGFGVQYSVKFPTALVELPSFRLYKKPIYIRWFPELLISVGMINLENDSFRFSGIHQTNEFFLYYQYGLVWNLYANKWSHISLMYLQEYQPSLKNNPHNYIPLQTKFVIKL